MAHTGKLGFGRNLGEKLNKVGEVVAEELGGENEALARVIGKQLSAEQLGLANDTEGRPAVGVLGADRVISTDGGRAAADGCVP